MERRLWRGGIVELRQCQRGCSKKNEIQASLEDDSYHRQAKNGKYVYNKE